MHKQKIATNAGKMTSGGKKEQKTCMKPGRYFEGIEESRFHGRGIFLNNEGKMPKSSAFFESVPKKSCKKCIFDSIWVFGYIDTLCILV